MKNGNAVLVSESGVLRSALEAPLAERFERVLLIDSIDEFVRHDNWENSVFIIDCSHLDSLLPTINRHARLDANSKFVLLLRSAHTLDELNGLAERVEAILPPATSSLSVARIARVVQDDMVVLPKRLLEALRSNSDASAVKRITDVNLTAREKAILDLIAEGCGNKVIANRLEISDSTVRVHVRSILRKLKLQNRTQAALYAIRR